MVLGNSFVTASNVTSTSNICQFTVALPPGFGTLTTYDGTLQLIDSAYYAIQMGTVTTSCSIVPQILLANNTWVSLTAPQVNTGAPTAISITASTGNNYFGSFNVLAATAGQPGICLPALGVRLSVTITAATITFAQILFSKR